MKVVCSDPVLVSKTEELCESYLRNPSRRDFPAVRIRFPELDDNQVLVIQLKDGTILTFANRNILNGVCDDCTDTESLYEKEIVQYQIITFEKE